MLSLQPEWVCYTTSNGFTVEFNTMIIPVREREVRPTLVRGRVVGIGRPSAFRVSFSSSVRFTWRLHMKCLCVCVCVCVCVYVCV